MIQRRCPKCGNMLLQYEARYHNNSECNKCGFSKWENKRELKENNQEPYLFKNLK
jgi:DNA-directed RNA polymerase subunit M/transcription elongation factor TFIIS